MTGLSRKEGKSAAWAPRAEGAAAAGWAAPREPGGTGSLPAGSGWMSAQHHRARHGHGTGTSPTAAPRPAKPHGSGPSAVQTTTSRASGRGASCQVTPPSVGVLQRDPAPRRCHAEVGTPGWGPRRGPDVYGVAAVGWCPPGHGHCGANCVPEDQQRARAGRRPGVRPGARPCRACAVGQDPFAVVYS